jgi:hypothetical protein
MKKINKYVQVCCDGRESQASSINLSVLEYGT